MTEDEIIKRYENTHGSKLKYDEIVKYKCPKDIVDYIGNCRETTCVECWENMRGEM